VAAGIRGARLETIDRAGHVPHIETPALFRHLVIDFLKEDLAA
jgi:pimeloyl-ACP methyl ester carboxylesterase